MNRYTPGAWRYMWDAGVWKIFTWLGEGHRKKLTMLAEVLTQNVDDPKANARLIASAPEMYLALVNSLEALRATEVFMCGQGLETDTLNAIICTIDELLDRVDGKSE